MGLTKAIIDKITLPDSGQALHWDDAIPGFALKVSSTGLKSFVLDYRINGKRFQKVIGRYGEITPTEARQIALEWKAKIGKGIDPAKQKETGITFARMCDIYWERYGVRKKSSRDDMYRINKLKPVFGSLTLAKVTRERIADFHHSLGSTRPYEANRIKELIGRIFELAKAWGFYPEDAPNPVRRIEKFPEVKRERFVSAEEMPRLVAAIDQEDSPYIKAIIWMYLLLGVRKSELLRLKWADVDMVNLTVTIQEPKGKAGTKSHVLPLPKAVAAILKDLPKVVGNPHLFPGHHTGKHLVVIDKPWRRIRERAKLNDVRIHDLRRTLGSWMAQSGVPINIIGKILNHSQLQTTQIYARLSTEPLREFLDDHAARLLKSAKQ